MKKALFLAIGLAISVVCLYFVLHKVDLAQLLQVARTLNWTWVAICTVVFYAGFYLRAVRWVAFFPPEPKLKGRHIVGPMMTGYALNSLFPGRVGEPARAYLVARREKISIAAALSSVVAERFVDIATILGLLGVLLVVVPFGDFSMQLTKKIWLNQALLKELGSETALFFALPLAICIILMMNHRFRAIIQRIIESRSFLPRSVKNFLINLMHSFAQGFEGLKSPRQALLIVIYSLLIWGSAGWGIALLAPAFGIQMTFLQGAVIMVIICFAIMPAATPGYWGFYELGFVFGAKVLGIQADQAHLAAMALMLHLIQYVPIVIWGMLWASLSGTSLVEAKQVAALVEDAPETVEAVSGK